MRTRDYGFTEPLPTINSDDGVIGYFTETVFITSVVEDNLQFVNDVAMNDIRFNLGVVAADFAPYEYDADILFSVVRPPGKFKVFI